MHGSFLCLTTVAASSCFLALALVVAEPSLTTPGPALYVKIAPSKNSFPPQVRKVHFSAVSSFKYFDSYSKYSFVRDSFPFFKSRIRRLEKKGNVLEPYLEIFFDSSRHLLVF